MRGDRRGPGRPDKKTVFRPQQKGADRRPQDPQRSGGALDEIRAQMEAGKYSRASASLKQVLASDPDDPEALRLAATLHIKLGSRVSARAAFDKLVKMAFDQQDYVSAESLLREAVRSLFGESHPQVVGAAYDLAQFLVVQERPEEAEELLRQCLSILEPTPANARKRKAVAAMLEQLSRSSAEAGEPVKTIKHASISIEALAALLS